MADAASGRLPDPLAAFSFPDPPEALDDLQRQEKLKVLQFLPFRRFLWANRYPLRLENALYAGWPPMGAAPDHVACHDDR